MAQNDLLGVREAADILGVHPQTLYRWCEEGLIAYVQMTPRSRRRFRRTDVLALLEPKLPRSETAS